MLPGAGSYLFYVSERYALAVLRPLQQEIRAAGGDCAWFFDGPGAEYLRPDERQLESVAQVREYDPLAVFVPGNLVPSFFPGIKVELFHGFSVGKRSESRGHFRIRGLFDLYCTQGPTTTGPFMELARRHGDYAQVGVAAVIDLDDYGVCRDARLVYLNVGEIPMVAVKAASLLVGEKVTEKLMTDAAQLASQQDNTCSGRKRAPGRHCRRLACEGE